MIRKPDKYDSLGAPRAQNLNKDNGLGTHEKPQKDKDSAKASEPYNMNIVASGLKAEKTNIHDGQRNLINILVWKLKGAETL